MGKVIDISRMFWRRQGKEILRNMNWQVNDGEHWAVLGLNGAGKTTLLNMVNGYIWPTEGEVTVLGKKFGTVDIRELRKMIGWVSSSLGERVNGRHTVKDIIVSGKFAAVGLDFEDPSETDFQKADGLMSQLGIEYLSDKLYEVCSNGEKQKTLIARALMANPKLLILDEATSGLDFVAREELLETIESLALETAAPTIIFVTHHIEEVLPVFSHTLLLKDGTVFAQGERRQVLSNENMSKLYQRKITVNWRQDRPWMTLS